MRSFLVVLVLAAAASAATPTAREVIVRGGGSLPDRLVAATAGSDGRYGRPVILVVDVTPNLRAARSAVREALEVLRERVTSLDGRWRIAALGRTPSDAVRHPSGLVPHVDRVLAEETPEANTLRALRRTLGACPDRNDLVVYLADWRFEDEDDLEGFIASLRRRGRTLNVIGSEACINRAWNDGLPRFAFGDEAGEEGIGRNPFGPRDPEAPWHGGDTAYPRVPYSFGGLPWQTEFPLLSVFRDGDRFEDLAERLGRLKSGGTSARLYPLSSSWGPYSLMRAAAETGGHYWLHSFNPEGRVDVVYDYARCNLFPPDLRSRREIRASARRPLSAAVIGAWQRLSDPSVRVVDLTPPITRHGAPSEIGRVREGRGLSFFWHRRADHERFLRDASEVQKTVGRAAQDLARVVTGASAKGPGEARAKADAELLLHILRVLAFDLGEAVLAARKLPADAWKVEGEVPGIAARDWIRPRTDPVTMTPTSLEPHDPKAAAKVREQRIRYLEKFGGTPFGETVHRNPIVTYRFQTVPDLEGMDMGDIGRTPSESDRDDTPTERPRTRPPGGSAGGGPATGR